MYFLYYSYTLIPLHSYTKNTYLCAATKYNAIIFDFIPFQRT